VHNGNKDKKKKKEEVAEAAPAPDAEYGKGYSAALVKKLEVVVMAYTKEFLGHAILGTFNKFLKSELHAKDPGGKKGLAMVKKAGIDPNQNWVKIIMFTGPGIGGVIGSRKREERLKTLAKMNIPHDTNESDGVKEAVSVDRRSIGFKEALKRQKMAKEKREAAKIKSAKEQAKTDMANIGANHAYDSSVESILASANSKIMGEEAPNVASSGAVDMNPTGKNKKDKKESPMAKYGY